MNFFCKLAAYALTLSAIFMVVGCGLPMGYSQSMVFGTEGRYDGHIGMEFDLKIFHLAEDSIAGNLGLKAGDKITKVNDVSFDDSFPFLDYLDAMNPGDDLRIEYLRDGREYECPPYKLRDADFDVGRNYLVYGSHTKQGETVRRWLHLGVVALGDWTGEAELYDLRDPIIVDVLPERALRTLATVLLAESKLLLIDYDLPDFLYFNKLLGLPTFCRYLSDDGKTAALNFSVATYINDSHVRAYSVYPLVAHMRFQEGGGYATYLTPFNVYGSMWSGAKLWDPDYVRFMGLIRYQEDDGLSLYPIYSRSSEDEILPGAYLVPLLSLCHVREPEYCRFFWIKFPL